MKPELKQNLVYRLQFKCVMYAYRFHNCLVNIKRFITLNWYINSISKQYRHKIETIHLTNFNTYFCDVEFGENKTKITNLFFRGILININEDKTIQKPRKKMIFLLPAEKELETAYWSNPMLTWSN